MNLLSFTYIPIPTIPIRTGSGCDVSTLPTYAAAQLAMKTINEIDIEIENL